MVDSTQRCACGSLFKREQVGRHLLMREGAEEGRGEEDRYVGIAWGQGSGWLHKYEQHPRR